MPKITVPKESLEGPKRVPPGIYFVRMNGFNPEYSKAGDSYNLLPDLRIVQNPDYHDRRPGREWLNSKAGWAILDFCHCFGEHLVQNPENPDGSPDIPGEFKAPNNNPDPKTWQYEGPLLNRVGKIELAETYGQDGKGPYINIKRYFCAIPGCMERHSEDLLR